MFLINQNIGIASTAFTEAKSRSQERIVKKIISFKKHGLPGSRPGFNYY